MLFGPCAQGAAASFLPATNSLCAGGVGFITAMMGTLAANARTAPAASMIVIEDDGPGVSAEARTVLERGIRLDQRKDGAGLGLAIVQDVLEAYGWRLVLDASHDLGGLQATIAPVSASISDQNVSGQLTNC